MRSLLPFRSASLAGRPAAQRAALLRWLRPWAGALARAAHAGHGRRRACCSGVLSALWRSSSILRQGTRANLRLAPFHNSGWTSPAGTTLTTSFCGAHSSVSAQRPASQGAPGACTALAHPAFTLPGQGDDRGEATEGRRQKGGNRKGALSQRANRPRKGAVVPCAPA